jgi:hypothetical protein
MNSKERLFHSAVIGLHEPIMPLYHDANEKGPVGIFLQDTLVILAQNSTLALM